MLNGGILILNIPFKWKFAFLGLLGIAVLMLVVGNTKRILLFVLAFTVPITFGKALIISPGRFSLTKGAGINLADVLVLMLLLLFLAKWATRKTKIQFFPWVTVPVVMWLILSSFSLLTARDEQLVIIQLINMFKLLLLCWVVANSVVHEADITFVIVGLLLAAVFQAGVGAYQGITGHPVGLGFLSESSSVFQQKLGDRLVNRVQGTMGHPNSYALYLTTVIPFALGLIFSKVKTSLKILLAMTLGLVILALIYSLSRSSWIDFLLIVSIVLMLAVHRKLISLGVAFLIAGIVCSILLGLVLFGTDLILSRLTSDDQGSAYGRITLAQTALSIIKDHPWVGVGLNNYMLVSPQYDSRAYSPGIAFVVHNVYLLIAAETGVIGLMAFLGLLAVLMMQSWRIISHTPNAIMWIAGIGTFCALVSITVFSIADYSLLGASQITTQFGLLAGLAGSLSQRLNPRKELL